MKRWLETKGHALCIWLAVMRVYHGGAPMTQERGPNRPVSDAFKNVDEIDWWHLMRCIPDSGHGRFWKTVFRDIRSDLGLPPPEELFD